jgi:hypothetical protein
MRALRRLGALGALLVTIALGVGALPAGAQIPDDERPPLVTDYANYPGTPQAFLTPGCDGTGVIDPEYSVTFAAGGTAGPTSDLDALPTLAQDDLITMAWDDVAPECVGSAVSFVVKVALGPSRDPNVDQVTGPDGGYSVEFLVAGPGSISFPMPDLARFNLGCDYQLDAIVGIPLRVIGPSGSFFTQTLRELMGKNTADDRTTLISAKHGVYLSCVVPDTTPLSVAPESTTTTAPPPVTTGGLSSTTTAPPPVTTGVLSSTTEASPPAADVQAVVVSQGEKVAVAAAAAAKPLPTTGFPTGLVALTAFGLVMFGLALLAIARVRDGHPFG